MYVGTQAFLPGWTTWHAPTLLVIPLPMFGSPRPELRARRIATHATAALALLGLTSVGSPLHADEPGAAERLLAVTTADPMDYASVARRVGDGALARVLADEAASVELRLAVVRAAPFARAPEQLLAPIVELAHGTDPTLAPAALTSADQIAQGLEFAQLEQREAEVSMLAAPAARLRELGEDDEARSDLRMLAQHAAARLTALQSDVTEE